MDTAAAISFQYPANLQIHKPAQGDWVAADCGQIDYIFSFGSDLYQAPFIDPIQFIIKPSNSFAIAPKSLDDYLTANPEATSGATSKQPTKVDGQDALWFTDQQGYQDILIYYKGNILEASSDAAHSDLLHAIILTLKVR